MSIYSGFGIKNNTFTELHASDGSHRTSKPRNFGLEYFGYFDVEKKITDKLKVRSGIRYSGLWNYGPNFIYHYDPDFPQSKSKVIRVDRIGANKTVAHHHYLEPRFSLNYQWNNQLSLKLAFDRLTQYIHRLSNSYAVVPFDAWTPSNDKIKPTLVDQYSMAAVYTKPGWEIGLDLYYKRMKNRLVFKENANLFLYDQVEALLLPAESTHYGFELGIQKNTGNLQGYVNYTWSRSFIKTNAKWQSIQINKGRYFPSNFDRPHKLNLILSYPISTRVELNTKFTIKSGRPITLPLGKIDDLLIYSERNAYRLPIYHRLDLSVVINPKTASNRKLKGQWVFSVLNVYGRKNPFSFFLVNNEGNFRFKQLSIIGSMIPTFSYNIKL